MGSLRTIGMFATRVEAMGRMDHGYLDYPEGFDKVLYRGLLHNVGVSGVRGERHGVNNAIPLRLSGCD